MDDLLRDFKDFDRRCYANRMHVQMLVEIGELDRARTVFARMSEECPGDPELNEAQKAVGVAPPVAPAVGQ